MKNKTSRKKLLAASEKLNKLAQKRKARNKLAADAVGGARPSNGGFQGKQLADNKDSARLGKEEFGYAIPPELEQAIAEGKGEDSENESYTPGVLIPPGLEEAVMAVTDPEDLDGDDETRFDLVPFAPADATTASEVMTAGAHWVLFANGSPLAKIDLKDQENAERIAAHFVSEDYARSVIDGISSHGLGKTLASVKARTYVAKVDENAKIKEIKAKLEAASKEALRKQIAAAKDKFEGTLDMVLEASAANFIVENALKDSLVSFMVSAGMPEQVASEGVDNAFFSKGPKTIRALLDKSEEWSNYSNEARSELRASLDAAGRRSRPLPSQLTPAQTNPDYDQNLANRMAASAVPVMSSSVSAGAGTSTSSLDPNPASAEDKGAFRARFGGFSTY